MNNSKIERTLIVFKPDAVSRGIVGEILSRFEKTGLKIVGSTFAVDSINSGLYSSTL